MINALYHSYGLLNCNTILIFNRSVAGKKVPICCQEALASGRILYVVSYSYWLHLDHITNYLDVTVDGRRVFMGDGLLDPFQSQTG